MTVWNKKRRKAKKKFIKNELLKSNLWPVSCKAMMEQLRARLEKLNDRKLINSNFSQLCLNCLIKCVPFEEAQRLHQNLWKKENILTHCQVPFIYQPQHHRCNLIIFATAFSDNKIKMQVNNGSFNNNSVESTLAEIHSAGMKLNFPACWNIKQH